MTRPVLRAAGRPVPLARPLLMGIVNATPDSFSDAGELPSTDARLARGRALLEAGADILDVGGESASGHRPAVAAAEEIARVVPVVEGLVAAGALVSVDTHKPAVAAAAVAGGAAIVNDVSGLRDPELAAVCAGVLAKSGPGSSRICSSATPAAIAASMRSARKPATSPTTSS